MTTALSHPTAAERLDAGAGAVKPRERVAHPVAAEPTVREAMIRKVKTCPGHATVGEIRTLFDDRHVHAALLLAHDDTLLAVLERADLGADIAGDRRAARFGRLEGRTITADAALASTRETMSNAGRRRLAVIDGRHRLLGLLCLKASGLGFCSDLDVSARSTDPNTTPAPSSKEPLMTNGIPASELSDADLNQDLAQLDRTRADIESSGTDDQKRNHVERSEELKAEAERRFGSAPASMSG
jgi:CBS domain-containing protein